MLDWATGFGILEWTTRMTYRKWQKFRGWKVSRFAGLIRYVGKSFMIFSITTFIYSWLSNSTKQLQVFQWKFKYFLKLSLAYLEMDECTLLKHVCADFTLFRMIMQSQEEKATVEVSPRWNRSLTASLLASSASYFLISWQKHYRFFATAVEYLSTSNISKFFMMSTFSGAKV